MLSRRTLLAGLPILLLWGAATAWLIDRQRAPKLDVVLDAAVKRLEQPTDTWMTLEIGRHGEAQRLGTIHIQQIPEAREGGDGKPADGVRLEVAVEMTLRMFGRATDLELSGFAWRPWVGERAEFAWRVRSGDSDFAIDGTIRDRQLVASVHSAGETIPLDMPLASNALFESGFGAPLSLPRLEIGDQVRIDSFDPMTLRPGEAKIRCIAEQQLQVAGETIDTRVLIVESGGLATRAWVDAQGEVVRAETALGITLMRSTAEEAARPIPARDNAGELLQITAIRPTGQPVFRGASEMVFAVTGSLPESGLPQDSTQQLVDASERVYRASTAAGSRQRPATGPGKDSHQPVPPGDFLGSDPFIQADHPKIVAKSREILDLAHVNAATDPEAAALALYEWVFTHVDKVAVLSLPSALDVLSSLRGDCNEHAVLYAALARAAGLRTRIAIGVVWSEVYDGFYYHAWPEVWLAGHWRWIDPTLGQPLADATHIKLLNGGIEQWPQLLPFLGELQIDVRKIR